MPRRAYGVQRLPQLAGSPMSPTRALAFVLAVVITVVAATASGVSR